jgi:transposase
MARDGSGSSTANHPRNESVGTSQESFPGVSQNPHLELGVLPVSTAHRGDVRCGGRRHGRAPTEADGRRVFSTEFKRTTVQRILSGEKTLAELSRELDISPSVIRTWKRFAESGATTAVQASEDVVPASQLRDAYAKIRELERALGRKTMEIEILRAAQEVVKKTPSLRRESGR